MPTATELELFDQHHGQAQRIPTQYRGLAKSLRAKIVQSSTTADDAAERLLAPIRPGEAWYPVPTRKRLEFIAQTWRAFPPCGRLNSVVRYDKGKLEIGELRLVGSVIGGLDWNEDERELSLAVRLTEIVCKPPEALRERTLILSTVGLHALARCYQRGLDHSDQRVLADLTVLARAALEAIRDGDQEVRIPAPSGGAWVGQRYPDSGLIIRTFLAARPVTGGSRQAEVS